MKDVLKLFVLWERFTHILQQKMKTGVIHICAETHFRLLPAAAKHGYRYVNPLGSFTLQEGIHECRCYETISSCYEHGRIPEFFPWKGLL